MIKVPACNSAIVKIDQSGRQYRWHGGRGYRNGSLDIPPSRYYLDTGVQFFETEKGLTEAEEFYRSAQTHSVL